MMNRIARAVEPSLIYHDAGRRREGDMGAILSHAVCDVAEDLDATVIACPTQSGSTARSVSKFRPRRPIVAASPDPVVLQQLALEWAVVPMVIESASSTEDLWRRTMDAIRHAGLASPGERVVLSGRHAPEPAGHDRPHRRSHDRVGVATALSNEVAWHRRARVPSDVASRPVGSSPAACSS